MTEDEISNYENQKPTKMCTYLSVKYAIELYRCTQPFEDEKYAGIAK